MPLGTATRSDGNGDFRLSGDGRALYFTSHVLQGGFGNSDIWVCRRVLKAANAPSMQSNIVYLDDLQETSYDGFVRLYKPERNAQDAASLQNPFPGTSPVHSLIMHPLEQNAVPELTAQLVYELAGKYASFQTIFRSAPGRVNPLFAEVWGDGKPSATATATLTKPRSSTKDGRSDRGSG